MSDLQEEGDRRKRARFAEVVQTLEPEQSAPTERERVMMAEIENLKSNNVELQVSNVQLQVSNVQLQVDCTLSRASGKFKKVQFTDESFRRFCGQLCDLYPVPEDEWNKKLRPYLNHAAKLQSSPLQMPRVGAASGTSLSALSVTVTSAVPQAPAVPEEEEPSRSTSATSINNPFSGFRRADFKQWEVRAWEIDAARRNDLIAEDIFDNDLDRMRQALDYATDLLRCLRVFFFRAHGECDGGINEVHVVQPALMFFLSHVLKEAGLSAPRDRDGTNEKTLFVRAANRVPLTAELIDENDQLSSICGYADVAIEWLALPSTSTEESSTVLLQIEDATNFRVIGEVKPPFNKLKAAAAQPQDQILIELRALHDLRCIARRQGESEGVNNSTDEVITLGFLTDGFSVRIALCRGDNFDTHRYFVSGSCVEEEDFVLQLLFLCCSERALLSSVSQDAPRLNCDYKIETQGNIPSGPPPSSGDSSGPGDTSRSAQGGTRGKNSSLTQGKNTRVLVFEEDDLDEQLQAEVDLRNWMIDLNVRLMLEGR